MAGVLISVRSADEARAALAGGADVIDVKEPARGALGRSDVETWRAVRGVVPDEVPLSVALGELCEWGPETAFEGQAVGCYRKVGLARAGRCWRDDWAALRERLGPFPRWVAVAYADWERAQAPRPELVLEEALRTTDCAGVLVDTWDKSSAIRLDESIALDDWRRATRQGGRLLALAGRLDEGAIQALAPIEPDLFAVRGAACRDGDRYSEIDAERVRRLVRAARAASRLNGPVVDSASWASSRT